MLSPRRLLPFLVACVAHQASPGLNASDLESAIRHYDAKEYAQAADILEALHRSSPENPDVLYQMGRVARRQKRLDQSVALLERAHGLSPENVDYLIALGDAYGALASKSRSFSLATRSRSALEKAVALAPRSERARAALIDYCREAPSIAGGGISKAYAQANELRELDEPAGTRLLVPLLLADRKSNEAANTLIGAIKRHPDDYSLNYLLGRIAATEKIHAEAGIAALSKCLSLPPAPGFPGHEHAHVRLGQLHAQKGAFADARMHFGEALKLDPDSTEAKTGLATLPETAP